MKRCVRCLLMAGFFATRLGASQDEDLFSRGNAAFSSGKYLEAVQAFQSLTQQGDPSPEVLFNLGNSEFRAGDTGHAVLYYERALWMVPQDPDIRANLKFVQRAAGIFETEGSWWKKLVDAWTLNQWSMLALAVWIVLCSLVAWRLVRRNRRSRLNAAVGCAAIALALFVTVVYLKSADLDAAVVVVPDASLKVAPIENSPSLHPIPAGTRVDIKKDRGEFVYVETLDEKRGWMKVGQVDWIVPRSRLRP